MNTHIQALKQLRVIGFIEGVSYLTLLFIAMPLKYLAHWDLGVKLNGWLHGVLFTLYAIAVVRVWMLRKWPFKRAFMAGLVSLIPWGTFWFDKTLRQEQESLQ
jgi:integral membrane protein